MNLFTALVICRYLKTKSPERITLEFWALIISKTYCPNVEFPNLVILLGETPNSIFYLYLKVLIAWLSRKRHQYHKISQSMHIVGDTSK